MSSSQLGNMYLVKSHSYLVKSHNVLGNMYLVKDYNILGRCWYECNILLRNDTYFITCTWGKELECVLSKES